MAALLAASSDLSDVAAPAACAGALPPDTDFASIFRKLDGALAGDAEADPVVAPPAAGAAALADPSSALAPDPADAEAPEDFAVAGGPACGPTLSPTSVHSVRPGALR